MKLLTNYNSYATGMTEEELEFTTKEELKDLDYVSTLTDNHPEWNYHDLVIAVDPMPGQPEGMRSLVVLYNEGYAWMTAGYVKATPEEFNELGLAAWITPVQVIAKDPDDKSVKVTFSKDDISLRVVLEEATGAKPAISNDTAGITFGGEKFTLINTLSTTFTVMFESLEAYEIAKARWAGRASIVAVYK